MKEMEYNIGRFAKLAGVTPRALRYYESKGLISAKRHRENDYRFYTELDLERIKRILFFKQMGFSLEDIRELLKLLKDESDTTLIKDAIRTKLVQCQKELSELDSQRVMLEDVLRMLTGFQSLSFETFKFFVPEERKAIMQTLSFESASLSTIGQRVKNEDFTKIYESSQGNIYLIADGMGGHVNGALASQMACEYIVDNLDFKQLKKDTYREYLNQLIQKVNEVIYNQLTNSSGERAATTLTFLVTKDRHAYIAHVGDTRIYRYQNQTLTLLTHDHSLIQRKLDRGDILQKDISTDPDRNILYAILGYEIPLKHIQTYDEKIASNSQYILMSDGISQVLSETEILSILNAEEHFEDAIERLITLSQKHGEDNATALGVKIEG